MCLESIAPYVDEIVIGLGGESTDDTEAIAREFTDRVISIDWKDDFSDARNQVLAEVTGDYFFWVDGDDEVIGGEHLRRLIMENPNVDGFYMGYDYARDEQGNNVCYLIRERLVRLQDELPNRGWVWIGKVHEVMAARGFKEVSLPVDNVVIKHHKPPNKHDVNRNVDILYAQLEEQEPNPDPRILGYLCTENAGRGNFKEAILHGQRFIKVSGWLEERYQMQHRIADMYRSMQMYEKAVDADMDAIQMVPSWPDAWFGLAETYNAVENFQAVVEYTKIGASKEAPQTMLIINPLDYSYFPVVVLAGAYSHLGDFESALANYENAYRIRQEPLIAAQIELLKNEINLQNVTKAFLILREHLGRNDEWLKVRQLYDVVPKHLWQHPTIQETWQRSMLQTEHVINPQVMIDFYTGNPHWTPVNEDQIKDSAWLDYPRMRFALDTVRRTGAKTVVDWGCSDGFIALPLARETGVHVTGFDLDPRCVDLATVRAKEWGVDARFEVGNVDEIGGWEGPKADLAIFFEVLEHVVDPEKTLERIEKTAHRIIMTTPYLSWENGNIPAWDRLEPKGHLRIFDQYDIERILTPRGRIWNLYKEPWMNTGWLFVDYIPSDRHDKNIMIGAMGAPEPWNPRVIDTTGLGGSETAVVKLSEAFARQGHRPIVYSNIDEPGYYNGACYRDASHFRTEVESDVYIAWRAPEQADWEINTRCLVLWMHDTDAGDRLTPSRARKFDAIVVLSEWHKQFMLEKYPFIKKEKVFVIGNGVDLERFNGKVQRDPKRVIYSSSPDRGLDVILEGIWPKVVEAVPDAELHVYYGWNNFDKFAPIYPQLQEFKQKTMNLLMNSKNVVQHGRVSQKELAKAFQKSAIWLYPTYFTETFCITAIEAQLGGAVPITNNLAGLSETVKSGIILSQDVRNPEVQQDYASAVITLLKNPMKDTHRQVRKHAPAQSWDQVAALWRQNFL
jgi:glycosyltransferase involved in cell wall biosynthesis/tetratricopeptide (TPR) repeat protein